VLCSGAWSVSGAFVRQERTSSGSPGTFAAVAIEFAGVATPWLLLGMFAQGGIAEALVFRGDLFGRIHRAGPFGGPPL